MAWIGNGQAEDVTRMQAVCSSAKTEVHSKLLHKVDFHRDHVMSPFFHPVRAGEKSGFPKVRKCHSLYISLCFGKAGGALNE